MPQVRQIIHAMSINDPITVEWDDKRERYYLQRGNETFYNDDREWIQFDTEQQAENYRRFIMTGHTALPWKVVSGMIVRANDDAPIAHMDRSESASKAGIFPVERDNNAKFIVRACNAHDDMLDALEVVQTALANWRDNQEIVIEGVPVNLEEIKYCFVDDAIRKAKGE